MLKIDSRHKLPTRINTFGTDLELHAFMKKSILFAYLFFFAAACAGQNAVDTVKTDTAYTVQLNTVKVTAKWRTDADRYHYNQMKFYVTTVLPYVNAATKLFNDINAKDNEPGTSKKERRKYIDAKEDEMRSLFEDKIKDLNVTQGVLLMKLIARQTNENIYYMLTKFKNPMVAMKWQLWARLNGMNLNKTYKPASEPDLENIMLELGYPLPDSFATNP